MNFARSLLVLVLISQSFNVVLSCAPDVKFKEDHHRRKELEEKFMSNLIELKRNEDILLKAVETLKNANEKKDENEIDYKSRIAEIEKELIKTKEDHSKLLEKHETYMKGIEKPRTWMDTISKLTGDALGRLIYNGLCAALLIVIPLLLRPFQRRWLARVPRGDISIQEVTDADEDGVEENEGRERKISRKSIKSE